MRFFLVCLCLALLAGCSGHSPSSDAGRATVSVRWPEPTRLIPFAAQSVRVTLRRGDVQLGQALLVRPSGGGTASATFEKLPVGAATVSASAFPATDGTGVAQASGQTDVSVVAGQTAQVRLTLASTIDRLEVNPATANLTPGGAGTTLTAVARNVAGEVVLTSLTTIAWTSDNPSAATVAAGVVTPRASGTAIISARDTESGKQGRATITIGSAPGPAKPDLSFGPPTLYDVPASSRVDTADLDGDGRRDVVVTGERGQDLWILYGKGDGTLEQRVSILHRVDGLDLDALKDMNGDGRIDIVAHDSLGKIQVVFNQGNRTYSDSKATFVGGINLVVVADFTGDGSPDAAGLRPGSGSGGSFAILKNDGAGNLALTGFEHSLPHICEGLSSGDLNNDGKADLVAGWGANTVGLSGIGVFLGDGTGKFAQVEGKNWGTLNIQTPLLLDYDRDGRLDVVQSVYWDGTLVVYRGRGDGTLGDGVPYSSPPFPLTLRTGDLNGDGWPEIVTANAGSTHGAVLRNKGDATFADRMEIDSGGSNIRYCALADLNGDGKLDLLLSGESSQTVSVLLNTTP